jgi:hypothetical protein
MKHIVCATTNTMSASTAKERSNGLKVVRRKLMFRLYSNCPSHRNRGFWADKAFYAAPGQTPQKILGIFAGYGRTRIQAVSKRLPRLARNCCRAR